jgi:hypothetical protein
MAAPEAPMLGALPGNQPGRNPAVQIGKRVIRIAEDEDALAR